MAYGKFCPLAKAMEPLGEKWTLLTLRKKIPCHCGRFEMEVRLTDRKTG